MLTPRLTNCPDCVNILSLLEKIDCKLAELSKCTYNKIIYDLNTGCDRGQLAALLNYKRILLYRYYNCDYVSSFSLQEIASKVIILTTGAECDCIKQSGPYTTTTTTTILITTTTTTVAPTTTTTTTT